MISNNLAMAVYPSTDERRFSEVKKYADGFEDKIIISFELFNKKGEHIGWSSSGGGICKVANDCKEWAFIYADFILQSAFVPKGNFTSSYCIAEKNFSYPTLKETFHADTEPEAIFKACQWILDNKEAK